MPIAKEKLGRFTIGLNDSLGKKITAASFHQSLDGAGKLRVSVACRADELEKWKLSDTPPEATFEWDGKSLFKGNLLSSAAVGFSRVELVYGDALHRARKLSGNHFLKQQTLEACLQKLVAPTGLGAKFYGDFSLLLPGLQQGGGSFFDLLESLADKHGFHFTTRSAASQVLFIRAGQSAGSCSLDAKTQATMIQSKQSVRTSYDQVQFRYFDAQTMEPRERKLSGKQLYQPLQAFTSQSPFEEKLKWSSAGGSIDTHVTDRHHFEKGETLFAGHYSKKLMEQEPLLLSCFEPVGFPGDKIQIKNCPAPGLQDGAYLIASCHVEIVSAAPRMNLVAIRP